MISFNKVFLVGNLTKDPELRYTPQGTAVATLRIASNSAFKDKTGTAQKNTCFVNVVVWGQMAEVCNQYLQKGRQVLIEGRLQSRNWQNAEGKNRSSIEVVAARVQFMSSGQQREQQSSTEVDLGEAPEEVLNLESESSPNKEAI